MRKRVASARDDVPAPSADAALCLRIRRKTAFCVLASRTRSCYAVDMGVFLGRGRVKQLFLCGLGFVATACGGSVMIDDVGLNPGCWIFPAECDPRSPTSCSADNGCVVVVEGGMNSPIEITCSGPTPTGELGSHCDAESGCKAGALCAWNQRCARACCGDADCPEGQACHVLHGQLGTIGGCL